MGSASERKGKPLEWRGRVRTDMVDVQRTGRRGQGEEQGGCHCEPGRSCRRLPPSPAEEEGGRAWIGDPQHSPSGCGEV